MKKPEQNLNDEFETVREYTKEIVEIDGVTVIRKVRERECKMCKWFPFGLWIGQWAWILGGTVILWLVLG